MRLILTIVLTLALTNILVAQDKGIVFFEGTWDEALTEATEQEKLIFVDAFTVWCGPCKRMAKNVFTVESVGKFFNSNFINVKLDMEKGEGRTFRGKYGVNQFPTLLFIDGKGQIALKQIGGMPAESFVKLGEKALTKIDFSQEYAKKYEAGDRTPELLYSYAMSLVKSRKPSIKIANEYLRTKPDLSTQENLKFIFANTTEADSRIFTLMVGEKSAIIKMVGKERFEQKVHEACQTTLEKAMEFQSEDLMREAKEKMKDHCPDKSAEFALNADVEFHLKMGNEDEFIKSADKYLKKTSKDKPQEMNNLAAKVLSQYADNTKLMSSAEKWAKKSSESANKSDYFITYANVLLANGKAAYALEIAQKAMELSKAEGKDPRPVQMLIRNIENRV